MTAHSLFCLDNPVGLDGFAFVEFAAPDPDAPLRCRALAGRCSIW